MTNENKSFAKAKYFLLTKEIFIPILIVCIIVLGIYVVFYTSLFSLKIIKCRTESGDCYNPSISAELNKYLGINLITFDTSELHEKLLAGDFTISSLTLTRKLPSTLEVDIRSVYPKLAIKVGVEGKTWYTLDEKFRVIGIVEKDPQVVTIIVDNPPTLVFGQAITDQSLIHSLEVATKINEYPDLARSFSLTGDTITLNLEGGRRAILTTTSNFEEQIKSLQAVLSDFTMIKEVSIIDVRYIRPVLK